MLRSSAIAFIGVLLCLTGCKDKGASTTTPPGPDSKVSENARDSASSAAAAKTTIAAAKATPEQQSSTVGVQVAVDGVPPKRYTGAVLHRDELREFGTYFEQNRCVLVLLGGWDETQLRDPQCKFVVFRNLPNDHGDLRMLGHQGKLLQFDRQTGIAAIGFRQGFSSDTDTGLRLDRKLSLPVSGLALRTVTLGRGNSTIEFDAVSFSTTNSASGRLRFETETETRIGDQNPLLLTSSGQLAGFLRSESNDNASFVGVDALNLVGNQVGAKPVGVGFSGTIGSTKIEIEVAPVGRGMPSRIGLHHVELSG